MRYSTIKSHLRPYSILSRRKTTITHAFAAAIAPYDIYDESKLREAISTLGQDPDNDLLCAYCGSLAETWDHVTSIVRDRRFSGHGHTVGNLLPCCKQCNSRKGNKPWTTYLNEIPLSEDIRSQRIQSIHRYLQTYSSEALISEDSVDYQELRKLLDQILDLMGAADQIASRIRTQHKRSPTRRCS